MKKINPNAGSPLTIQESAYASNALAELRGVKSIRPRRCSACLRKRDEFELHVGSSKTDVVICQFCLIDSVMQAAVTSPFFGRTMIDAINRALIAARRG